MGGRENNLRPFHITSLALHMANTALIIVLLYLLFGNIWAAAAAGLLFGVHPMTVEPIPWVGERKTLLAAFFAFWSLILYVRYSRSGNWKSYAGCFLMYLLALMSKPTSVPLPVVMLLMDYWPLKRFSIKGFWRSCHYLYWEEFSPVSHIFLKPEWAAQASYEIRTRVRSSGAMPQYNFLSLQNGSAN